MIFKKKPKVGQTKSMDYFSGKSEPKTNSPLKNSQTSTNNIHT